MPIKRIEEGEVPTALVNWSFYRDRYFRLIVRFTRSRSLHLRLRWSPKPWRVFAHVTDTSRMHATL